MVICFEDHETGKCLRGSPSQERNYTTKMRIIDFGSAIDEFTLRHLYGSTGPSRAEQTSEYAPPEALLNSTWYQGPTSITLKLRAFMEMCILIPGSSSKHRFGATIYGNGVSPASWKCSEEFFARQIKSRDPPKLGFPDVSALRLVRHLLLWDPDDRLSVNEAMQHPYFKSLRRVNFS